MLAVVEVGNVFVVVVVVVVAGVFGVEDEC